MILIDAIPKARSREAILFLLTAYLEDRQFAGRLPAHLTALPLAGAADVMSRMEKLVAAMETSIRRLDFSAVDAEAEAAGVFDAAVNRLAELSGAGPAAERPCGVAVDTRALRQKMMESAA